jgi:hypothetical protein
VLHGEQRFELHRPLPTQGTIQATHRVHAVADKGPGRGALLYFDTEVRDAITNTPLASLRKTASRAAPGEAADETSFEAPAVLGFLQR